MYSIKVSHIYQHINRTQGWADMSTCAKYADKTMEVDPKTPTALPSQLNIYASATPSDIGFSVGQGINACSYEQCATSAPYSYHTQDDYTKSDAGFFIAGNKMPIFPSPAITYIWNINNTLCQVELTNMVYQTSNDRGVVQFDFSVFPVQDCSVQSVEVAYGNRMANIYSYTEQDIGVNEASCGLRSVYCAAITSINFVFNQGKSYISTYQQNPRVG